MAVLFRGANDEDEDDLYHILYGRCERLAQTHVPGCLAAGLVKIERLGNDLSGNVKRLKAFVPNYRLRVGDWRVLFDVDSDRIIIHDG